SGNSLGSLLNLAEAARYKALTKLHKGSSNISYRKVPVDIYDKYEFYNLKYDGQRIVDKDFSIPEPDQKEGFWSAQSAGNYRDQWKKLYTEVIGSVPPLDEDVDIGREGALLNEAGNCGPLSSIAFFYCLIHSTGINIELIDVRPDHMFVVLNRDPNVGNVSD